MEFLYCVAMLAVGFSELFHVVQRLQFAYAPCMEFCVVSFLPRSCRVVSRGSLFRSESCVFVVATASVILVFACVVRYVICRRLLAVRFTDFLFRRLSDWRHSSQGQFPSVLINDVGKF